MPGAVVSSISLNSRIYLRPLSRQLEDGVAIVGCGDQFLEMPPEGLDFLAWLEEGLTLAGARARFEALHSPFPDEQVLEVVNTFVECDFVEAVDDQALAPRLAPPKSDTHWLPQSVASTLFSKPVLIAWMVITAPAALLWITTPALWPRPADYFWADYNAIVILSAMLVWLLGMLLHETSHLLACRARGIEATITWTQRLGFFPMSQTLMHNIWAVPRRARLLPLAAGMAWDVLTLCIAVYLLYFAKTGLLALPWLAVKLLRFYVLMVTMALASQFWLFSKMDGYFLLSALLGQRNLQADTFAWLKAKLFKATLFRPPSKGMAFIYIYALLTIVWGGLFMGQFLLVSLPIKLQLITGSFLKMWQHMGMPSLDFYDGLGVFASQVLYYGLLIYAYLRDTLPSRWQS